MEECELLAKKLDRGVLLVDDMKRAAAILRRLCITLQDQQMAALQAEIELMDAMDALAKSVAKLEARND